MESGSPIMEGMGLAGNNAHVLGQEFVDTTSIPRRLYLSAQTATISTESPFYNPATSIFLNDGDYIHLGLLGVFPNYKMKYEGRIKYKHSDTLSVTTSLGGNFYKSNTSHLLKYEVETTRKEIILGISFEKKL